ncbi:3-deoxy-7-phosphoheptulonate synthase [Chromobacterium haemolyticum]|uniref:3-deoxy-7-phosphoheptulonate synthase n=1 Tax=Chromobacterium haemolyticum TaxID=394935 RepID=UPI001316D6D2|nr:3-deoxy-7-phosphoheptulonate synthase [Chromobacterium haemolyticum]BBH10798.1 hypothetical protein CH06BL_00460 [Chromobacterium haemolyticum]
MLTLSKAWSPSSWQAKPHTQMPDYDDGAALHAVLSRLSAYPNLVPSAEIRRLRAALADVARGEGFVIQAGDCAERFAGLRPDVLGGHYRLLERMAADLGQALQRPVLRIGRIAGQYAKPRSQPQEALGGLSLPSYRGDIVNGVEFAASARAHDPQRLESAYFHAAASLNYLRGLDREAAPRDSGYYVSHEALLLPYEQAQLQQDERGDWYCGSGHFLWVGERTRQLDGAHVEFLRGVNNPVGVKVGPGMARDELLRLIDALNPDNEAGRLTLITRFGAAHIQRLPELLNAVNAEGRQVLWLCDPMHGNGVQAANGVKTRRYEDILAEVEAFLSAHRDCGSHAGGVHLELSAQDVTECLGGPDALAEEDLGRAYHSSCDPRLNPRQALALTDRLIAALTQPSGAAARPAPDAAAPEPLINLAERLAASRPDSDRLCFVGPGFSLSYRQLNRAVRRQAAWLQTEGVAAGERVLIALDDGPELAVAFYAALAVGALPVVANPRLDAASLHHLLADAAPALCLGQSSQIAVWPAAAKLRLLDAGAHLEWLAGDSADDDWDDFARQPEDAPALIQYTSGSTGQAKGVVHSARSMLAVCSHFAAGQLRLGADDVLYSAPKSFFGYGMGNSLFFPLYLGACGVLDGAWPSAERVAGVLRQFRPTVLFAVPTLYRLLLEHGLEPSDVAIRLAFSAGAPLSAPLARRWRQRFGFDLHDGIGATEMCHVFATSYPDALRSGSVGRMLPGWEARIVDADGRDAPAGECGVLLVKAPSRALGYWRRPQEEQERFQDGWYRTGDLFSRDEHGYLSFHGREDDRFKVFGRWVVPVEIENLLAALLPELGDAYVVAAPDRDGEARPALILRAGDDREALVRLVHATLEAHLESYKRPALVLALEEIPLNKNGKPDRRAMAQLAAREQAERKEEKVC